MTYLVYFPALAKESTTKITNIPKNEYTYLHRIGRSGRWGRKGIAINFQTKYDISKLKYFEKYYNTEIVEMPLNFHEFISS